MREGGAIKAFGAGVLSSYGELQWMDAGRAELAPFDPYAKQPKMRWGLLTYDTCPNCRVGAPCAGGYPYPAQAAPPAVCVARAWFAEPAPRIHKRPRSRSYKDGFQRKYFVLDSFQAGARLLQVRAPPPRSPVIL